jgi:ATP-dependent DNA helicase DinG
MDLSAVLKDVLPAFEVRPAQQAMADAVARLMAAGGRLMIEAGTGTGKSLAYLVPALRGVLEDDERVLLSTHTLNLQAQLMHKDLPLALRALKQRVAVARAVGRGNYLCLLRLDAALDWAGPELFGGGRGAQLERLRAWATDGEGSGLREDLPEPVSGEQWEQLQVESFGCLGAACPHAARCRFLQDRAAVQAAQVVVANHALLLADTAARREGPGLLPEASLLVVDEAHHLASVAGQHLGLRLSRTALQRAFDRLQDPKRRRNLVDRLERDGHLLQLLEAARVNAAELFARAQALAGGGLALPPRSLDDTLSQPLAALAEGLRRRADTLKELPSGVAVANEAVALAARFDAFADALRAWLDQEPEESVFWVENESGRAPVLRSAPLDPGPLLGEELYPRFRSVLLCSATLSVTGDFSFMRRSLGLPEDTETLALPPAFDYARQVEMHLSAALPEPRDEEAYLDGLERGIRAALERSLGRAFVLGTNFRHLRLLHERLRPEIEARGWLCLLQDSDARRESLLSDFKEHGQAVLFGAASFWEGVDVPGEALSCVIVTRLPFNVPDTPLEKARQKKVEAQGGDPFMDLSLPEAVLRLKQGFGRLIRHSEDRGWFVLLDSRVLTKPYGRIFLRSLPACSTFVDGSPVVFAGGVRSRGGRPSEANEG